MTNSPTERTSRGNDGGVFPPLQPRHPSHPSVAVGPDPSAALCAKVTVVIVTRNREIMLRNTLLKIRQALPYSLPLRVVDDASDRPLSLDDVDRSAHLSRNRERRGLVTSRNDANLSVDTPYVLSFDDDSWPVGGDLEAAVKYMEATTDVLALSFPIRRPGGNWQVESIAPEPYPAKGFVGCGHLLNVRHFRSLGGYSAHVIHQGEEFELAARGTTRHLRCMHFPGFVVHHEHTQQARDMYRVLFHGGRNKVRLIRTFCPRPQVPRFLFRAFAEMVYFAFQHRSTASLRGWYRGLREPILDEPGIRFSPEAWTEWKALPYA